MAKKISQLTQATQVKSDDVTVIVQDGETKKLPLNMMVTKQDIENKKVAGLAKLDEIEATYENDTYTPTITVKNKSSVKTGEGDGVDYSANVMDGPAKSAILTGQTLVNLCQDLENEISTDSNLYITGEIPVKTNTKYIVLVKVKSSNSITSSTRTSFLRVENYSTGKILGGIVGDITTEYTAMSFTLNTNDTTSIKINLRNLYTDWGLTENTAYAKEIMLIEYIEGMENWDIPYFDGMQSVKMPVLTTVGKNLFNPKEAKLGFFYDKPEINENHPTLFPSAKINGLKPNTKYVVSSTYGLFIAFFDENKNLLGFHDTNTNKVFTTPDNIDYMLLRAHDSIDNGYAYGSLDEFQKDIQIEEGSTATPYEPYKSNILSTPSDLELRGIGDGQDTLDLMTGEVTERIGEVLLDGSENWQIDGNTGYYLTMNDLIRASNYQQVLTSDRLPIGRSYNASYTTTTLSGYLKNSLYPNQNWLYIVGSEFSTIDELKTWLSQNPTTVQYRLATESIKTVDLMPSGTHPSTTPYCWKNGHIQLSSSGLLPNLEYSVVTSRAGQINQNATMIVKNDKRIFDLEILLAGGLVNTTYQALTLQNQVETGLSKVSLNSETEPDYLLYHMIMKLIEEKAYKLDDLTEKVSVFYLYEKLSDEQFETIYSALYPFVEDEIIEEPVVEELPEVVEDEVIM